MTLVKVRRTGHSLSVTIPTAQARAARIEEGMYVEVEADSAGLGLRVEPVSIESRANPRFVAAARSVIAEEKELLDRLAAFDPDRDRPRTGDAEA
jgi:antitoxin component of MazEF toxin-antitoxin module